MWELEPTEDYERRFRRYKKKHPRELGAMLDNLDTFHVALNAGSKLPNIRYGFMHREPKGIIAIDQKGGGKALKECRLYVYPETETSTIFQLTIGDKNTQNDDVKTSVQHVENIRKQSEHDRTQSVQKRTGDGPPPE